MNIVIVPGVFLNLETERRLVSAAAVGDISTVRKLLRKGVNVNVRDELGNTALSEACKGGHTEIVRMLKESGADINLIIGASVSPLHAAAASLHTETVKQLVLFRADLDALNNSGLEPIDMTQYYSETWNVLNAARWGLKPAMEEVCEVPVIPDYVIARVVKEIEEKSMKNEKNDKKGKKNGKKGKKKGKKKK